MGGDQTKTVFVLQTIVKIFKRNWGRFGDAQINGRRSKEKEIMMKVNIPLAASISLSIILSNASPCSIHSEPFPSRINFHRKHENRTEYNVADPRTHRSPNLCIFNLLFFCIPSIMDNIRIIKIVNNILSSINCTHLSLLISLPTFYGQ